MDENVKALMEARHSVRQYLDKPIPEEVKESFSRYVEKLNEESGLNIQVFYDEPECFSSRMAHYGKFENAVNYIAIVGKSSKNLDELGGYYGEKAVLEAQRLGLNTCWVALTHGKSKAVVEKREEEVIIISLGYGKTQGVARKSKKPEDVGVTLDSPEWFKEGVNAALLAPTAINQQKFGFTLKDGKVKATSPKIGPCLKIDLGIVKCHFELGAGKENFDWE